MMLDLTFVFASQMGVKLLGHAPQKAFFDSIMDKKTTQQTKQQNRRKWKKQF